MANPSKKRGSAWESSIVAYLIERGWPVARLRTTHTSGSKDRGDIAGIPGVVIEAKAERTYHPQQWMREAEVERLNDGAGVRRGVVQAQRQGQGSGRRGDDES